MLSADCLALVIIGAGSGNRNLIYMGVHSKKRYLIGLHGSKKNPIAPYGWHTFGTPCAKFSSGEVTHLLILQ